MSETLGEELDNSYGPNDLKKANPTNKKDKKEDSGKYRPVSLTYSREYITEHVLKEESKN